eukprot:2236052-Rhodomonas_salina.1
MSGTKPWGVQHCAVACPATGCLRRFSAADLALELTTQVQHIRGASAVGFGFGLSVGLRVEGCVGGRGFGVEGGDSEGDSRARQPAVQRVPEQPDQSARCCLQGRARGRLTSLPGRIFICFRAPADVSDEIFQHSQRCVMLGRRGYRPKLVQRGKRDRMWRAFR